MTWIQPPGYVHQMISLTFVPHSVAFTQQSSTSGFSFSAQVSSGGDSLVARLVNVNPSPLTVQLNIKNATNEPEVTYWTITSPKLTDANTPAHPTLVSPQKTVIASWKGQITLPMFSYNILEMKVQ